MSRVACAQLRYTWAERRLDGRGPGFGVVLRSRDWPEALLADAGVRDLLTHLPTSARREQADGAPLLAHRRVAGGSLLVAKRAVGTDGSGRPGNYSVHALFDPTGTLGALDLAGLVDAGVFRLEREVDVVPDPDAPALPVEAAARWTAAGPAAERPSVSMGEPGVARVPVLGDPPLHYPPTETLAVRLAGLTRRLPADLVNGLDVEPGAEPSVEGGLDRLALRFDDAVALGAADREPWWERRGRDVESWAAELESFVVLRQPVREVPDHSLWTRWDHTGVGGRTQLARELLQRPHLADDPAAMAALGARPGLVEGLVTVAAKGSAKGRRVAGALVAAAGTDAEVVALADAVLAVDDGLPAPLVARLQGHEPDALSESLAEGVAAGLDGAVPMSDGWRAHCLALLVDGLPTCAHAEVLVTQASDAELASAVAGVPDPATAADAWERLSSLLPPARLTAVFAAAGRWPAEFVLTHPLAGVGLDTQAHVWPALTRSSGWADWPRTLVTRLRASERQLRRQRLVLLVLVGLLAATVLVLGLMLRFGGASAEPGGPSAPRPVGPTPTASLVSPAPSVGPS